MDIRKRLWKTNNSSFFLTFVILFAFSQCQSHDHQFWTSYSTSIPKTIGGNSLNYVMTFVTLFLIDVVIGEMIRRLVVFIEEITHFTERYDKNILAMLQYSFICRSQRAYLLAPILVASMTYLNLNGGGMNAIVETFHTKWNLILILSTSLIPYLLRLHEPTKSEMFNFMEEQKLNVGHGLAWSYYFGYLKLIVPGLQERIDLWKKTKQFSEKSTKVIPKLYILVPKSCYCYPSIQSADKSIQSAGQTPPFVANRAGNQRREYKNTMYTFSTETQDYYCLVEYATPVLSLYEMSYSDEAGLSRQERLNQMNTFVRTLRGIINSNPDIKGCCSLIVYNDKHQDGTEPSISSLLKVEIEKDLEEEAKSRSL